MRALPSFLRRLTAPLPSIRLAASVKFLVSFSFLVAVRNHLGWEFRRGRSQAHSVQPQPVNALKEELLGPVGLDVLLVGGQPEPVWRTARELPPERLSRSASLVRDQEAGGSNPLAPTIPSNHLQPNPTPK
jgi:hypothetical protein